MADFTPPPLDSIENDKFVPPSLDSVESFTPPSVESVGERVIDDPSVTSITARTTGYHAVSPESPEFRMEGGNLDKMGNPLHTLDAFYRGQVPWVGLAGDPRIPYGTSATSPQFPGVPFRIVDTGKRLQERRLIALRYCLGTRQKERTQTRTIGTSSSILGALTLPSRREVKRPIKPPRLRSRRRNRSSRPPRQAWTLA